MSGIGIYDSLPAGAREGVPLCLALWDGGCGRWVCRTSARGLPGSAGAVAGSPGLPACITVNSLGPASGELRRPWTPLLFGLRVGGGGSHHRSQRLLPAQPQRDSPRHLLPPLEPGGGGPRRARAAPAPPRRTSPGIPGRGAQRGPRGPGSRGGTCSRSPDGRPLASREPRPRRSSGSWRGS